MDSQVRFSPEILKLTALTLGLADLLSIPCTARVVWHATPWTSEARAFQLQSPDHGSSGPPMHQCPSLDKSEEKAFAGLPETLLGRQHQICGTYTSPLQTEGSKVPRQGLLKGVSFLERGPFDPVRTAGWWFLVHEKWLCIRKSPANGDMKVDLLVQSINSL